MSEIRNHLFLLALLAAGVAACSGEQSNSEPSPDEVPATLSQQSAPQPAPVTQAAEAATLEKVEPVAVVGAPDAEVEISPSLTLVYTNNIDGEIEPCG
jgi:hypothetical protein